MATKPTGRPRGRPPKNPPKDPNAPKRPRGRPPKTPAVDSDMADILGFDDDTPKKMTVRSPHISEIYVGVTQTWLMQAFHMDKKTVVKKLAECPVLKYDGSTKLYALHQAAPYLVKPKVDVHEYVMKMNPSELPNQLQDPFWSAMIKRQKWEENARQLWRSDDVLAVFGELAMTIKTRVQLWVEDIDRIHGLTGEMRTQLTQEADNLLQTIHELMIEQPTQRSTPSSVSQLEAPEQTEIADEV